MAESVRPKSRHGRNVHQQQHTVIHQSYETYPVHDHRRRSTPTAGEFHNGRPGTGHGRTHYTGSEQTERNITRRQSSIDLGVEEGSRITTPTDIIPSPPPHPPPGRHRSARHRTPRRASHDSGVFEPSESALSPASRPGSSFMRYTPLPSIKTDSMPKQTINVRVPSENTMDDNSDDQDKTITDMDTLSEELRDMHLQDRHNQTSSADHEEKMTDKNNIKKLKGNERYKGKLPTKEEDDEDINSYESMFKTLKRKVILPAEPSEKDDKIVLAIKLPNGHRVQRAFFPKDTLELVLNFAENSAELDFSGCELVCDVPKIVFHNLKTKLLDSGLQNRTVLHIQIPDN